MSQLTISTGQHSDKGRKETNQDFHGLCIPQPPQLLAKGIAIAIADGISSSQVSHIASQSAVTSFLQDYYCTSDAWSVKTSVERVLIAANSWLHAQTQQSAYRHDMDRGYVCTFSALVLKSTTAHLFHVGDSRIYQLRGKSMEQLTNDHRVHVSAEQSYLSRALGIQPQLEIDYRSLQVEQGDILILATDGVYEYADAAAITVAIAAYPSDLDHAARIIVEHALALGSPDNLTIQIVRVDTLPSPEAGEVLGQFGQAAHLPPPPLLHPRQQFDGYTIIREVHGSPRSHIYLATDSESGATVILKAPSIDLQGDPAYLERLLLEEWIARRIDDAHVLRPIAQTRKRNYLYVPTEYIEGQTLAQWMIDNPKPELEAVRGIIEQIAKGLRAFHRLEMLHRDLKPDNIMIDTTGTVKIIDFGSARVAGLYEIAGESNHLLGSAQYAAPEYFLGEPGNARSDTFSLGVIAYQMLTGGKLPYGLEVPKARTKAAQRNLQYLSAQHDERDIPPWIDEAVRKAVHPNPLKRYEETSEFVFDLYHPNEEFQRKTRPPLIERNPVVFWKGLSFVLMVVVLVLLWIKVPHA